MLNDVCKELLLLINVVQLDLFHIWTLAEDHRTQIQMTIARLRTDGGWKVTGDVAMGHPLTMVLLEVFSSWAAQWVAFCANHGLGPEDAARWLSQAHCLS